jgi:hypothetical protein
MPPRVVSSGKHRLAASQAALVHRCEAAPSHRPVMFNISLGAAALREAAEASLARLRLVDRCDHSARAACTAAIRSASSAGVTAIVERDCCECSEPS